MISAGEARSRTDEVRRDQRAVAERRETERSALEAIRRERAVTEILSDLEDEIPEAIGDGLTELRKSFDSGAVPSSALWEVRSHLRDLGYDTRVEEDKIDHGDSAAPCVRDYDVLYVSWEKPR